MTVPGASGAGLSNMDLAMSTCPVQQQLMLNNVTSAAAASSPASASNSKCSLLNSFTSHHSVTPSAPHPAAHPLQQNSQPHILHNPNFSNFMSHESSAKSSKHSHLEHQQHLAASVTSPGVRSGVSCPSQSHAAHLASPCDMANDIMTHQLLRAAAAGCFSASSGLNNTSCHNNNVATVNPAPQNFNPMANLMAAVSTATAAVDDRSIGSTEASHHSLAVSAAGGDNRPCASNLTPETSPFSANSNPVSWNTGSRLQAPPPHGASPSNSGGLHHSPTQQISQAANGNTSSCPANPSRQASHSSYHFRLTSRFNLESRAVYYDSYTL